MNAYRRQGFYSISDFHVVEYSNEVIVYKFQKIYACIDFSTEFRKVTLR